MKKQIPCNVVAEALAWGVLIAAILWMLDMIFPAHLTLQWVFSR